NCPIVMAVSASRRGWGVRMATALTIEFARRVRATRASFGAALLLAVLAAGGAPAQEASGQASDKAAGQASDQKADVAASADEQPDFTLLNETPVLPLRAKPSVSARGPSAGQTIVNRTDKFDGSVTGSVGERLPTAWEAKVGLDVSLAAQDPDRAGAAQNGYRPGGAPPDRSVGWASISVSGLAGPVGWDKATVDARVDPAQDQGSLATSLSRTTLLGDGVSVTLQNGYAVTQSLANPNGVAALGAGRNLSGDGAVRVELPSAIALSTGAGLS